MKIEYKAVGIMSGTSCDGIDLSLVKTDGLSYANSIYSFYVPYAQKLQTRLLYMIKSCDYSDVLNIERDLTIAYAQAVNWFREKYDIHGVDLIGMHGQTIKHDSDAGVTWQIGNPELLATYCKVDVVYDFRKKDMIYGGQGAPIIAVYHKLLAKRLIYHRILIINLGGIVNITWYNKYNSVLRAMDVCVCNALMNDWLSLFGYRDGSYDQDGELALKGKVSKRFRKFLQSAITVNTKYPRALDRDCSSISAYDHQISVYDGLATIASFIPESIVRTLKSLEWYPDITVVAGGGRKHKLLFRNLQIAFQKYNATDCIDVNNIGEDGDSLEASAFAYLAVRSLLNYPITGPELTGASDNISGGILCKYR
ncbi:MAG: hypothetical protein P857_347 [Candidatus Xenolissoclinum pacificiensis L6]|uniref:Anhydro-N-acetylmuramic acid kinase n=1 Tax=Candidatus Xenolissoclinum pacificiensis L6 TaxID=1401685 RepID=W2V194_9RICK|nr:MAG: hypothetical protein P857_347 [Candidatus Xenolissoclinum pacificiensis L6]